MGFEETVIHCSAPALCGIKPAGPDTDRVSAAGATVKGIAKAQLTPDAQAIEEAKLLLK